MYKMKKLITPKVVIRTHKTTIVSMLIEGGDERFNSVAKVLENLATCLDVTKSSTNALMLVNKPDARIKNLILRETKISDLSGIEYLPSIEILSLKFNTLLNSLKGIEKISNVNYFIAEGCLINSGVLSILMTNKIIQLKNPDSTEQKMLTLFSQYRQNKDLSELESYALDLGIKIGFTIKADIIPAHKAMVQRFETLRRIAITSQQFLADGLMTLDEYNRYLDDYRQISAEVFSLQLIEEL
jgi:hypothetical protein